MKQFNLLRTKGRKITVPFKSASRLFVMMMLLATALQVGAKQMYVAISRTEGVAVFYYDDMYDKWHEEENVTVCDVQNFRHYVDGHGITKVIFDISFSNARPTSTSRWFDGCKVLKEFIGLENLNTSNVTDMFAMFQGCSGLTSLDVSNFDTGNVTNMWSVFDGCSSLTNLDVSKFNTSKVTNMSSMFNGCEALTSIDVSKFNTNNVTNMNFMFNGCKALTNIDISNFNTKNVVDMSAMFQGCQSLTNLDVCKFNTDNVTNMGSMFSNCNALTSLDVSRFNTGNVTNMGSMFSNCSALTSLDVSRFNTGNVTNMGFMFNGCETLTSLDVSNFNTSNVTSMRYMFRGCTLTSLDLSSFETSNVTNMSNMFSNCESLSSLDVSKFNTGNVTDMNSMFYRCSSLTSLDVSKFNTSKVTDMSQMFAECKNITNLDVSNFNTSNVTNMSSMFYMCQMLKCINLRNFDTSNVKKIDYMFRFCSSLVSIFIGENMTQMPSFSDCMIKKIVSYQKEPYAIASNCFRNSVKETAKLYVPNDTRTIYTNTDGWKDFKHIVSKDLEPKDDENAGFGKDDIDENTDLDGNIVSNIFFNVPAEAGEYDAAENCIILKKATTDEQVKNIFGLDMFDEYLVNNFIGMIFMVDAGSGTIELEAETVGEMQLSVMVGTAEPITKQANGKNKVSIPYDVAEPALVYVYGSMPAAQSAKGMHKANAAENALKIYSMAWGKATGIRSAHSENSSQAIIYNLNGQRVKTPGKGMYIVNGKKVILK